MTDAGWDSSRDYYGRVLLVDVYVAVFGAVSRHAAVRKATTKIGRLTTLGAFARRIQRADISLI